ncbi:MAG TPA: hypothetical protein VFE24_03530 [Pirellulales bacterium]|jgi:hypothetical protein|nr:hypothetical protein [Pirellulales bacterium]
MQMFSRAAALLAMLALTQLSMAPTAQAAKKKTDVKVSGQITEVGKDDHSITVSSGKNGPKKELKLNDKTLIDYVGIDNQDEKKLQKGYFVIAIMGDNNVVASLSVKKTAFSGKK